MSIWLLYASHTPRTQYTLQLTVTAFHNRTGPRCIPFLRYEMAVPTPHTCNLDGLELVWKKLSLPWGRTATTRGPQRPTSVPNWPRGQEDLQIAEPLLQWFIFHVSDFCWRKLRQSQSYTWVSISSWFALALEEFTEIILPHKSLTMGQKKKIFEIFSSYRGFPGVIVNWGYIRRRFRKIKLWRQKKMWKVLKHNSHQE